MCDFLILRFRTIAAAETVRAEGAKTGGRAWERPV
jgi:hypothetical protein